MPLLAVANIYWFLLPLVLAISLVFNATRHEHGRPIFLGAVRWMTYCLVFMAIVFVVLLVLSWWT